MLSEGGFHIYISPQPGWVAFFWDHLSTPTSLLLVGLLGPRYRSTLAELLFYIIIFFISFLFYIIILLRK